MLKKIGIAITLLIVGLVVAHAMFRPPSLEGRTMTEAVDPSPYTLLGSLALTPPREADGKSGVLPLLDGPDALAARVALIRAAEVALDVQYYIWNRDTTGLILLAELREAAGRGVRVRLLLDDNGIDRLDADLAALDALPNIEVRLFNPFILRTFKPLGYTFDFARLNRRMHNKSLTADGAVAILGGRNVGDVYFGFGNDVQFVDTDVIVTGKVAASIGDDFDRYWQSNSSHPIDRIIGEAGPNSLERLMSDAAKAASSVEGQLYFERLRSSELVRGLGAGRVSFEWTNIVLVSDDPAKGLGQGADRDLMFPQLVALLSTPSRSVDLVSAYFIPGLQFSEELRRLADAGVKVRILTNSHGATDVLVVHSSYVKYREELLRSGIKLFELKPRYASRNEPDAGGFAVGPSRASLHSKTLAVDGERVFIGSFNFDPRSVLLNTEMGVLIDSPHMAEALSMAFSVRFPKVSYALEIHRGAEIVWDEVAVDGTHTRHQSEPGTTAFSRVLLWSLGLLPIEWLL